MEIENKILWMWIKNIFKGSSSKAFLLVKYFGGIRKVYNASKNDFKKFNLKDDVIKKLSDKNLDYECRISEQCKRLGIDVICIDDSNYPEMLKNIYDPPPVLYVKGNINVLNGRLVIAGVGTRDANAYGINTAKTISFELAGANVVIASGMALGIDTAMHTGALSVGGITVAVLGTAIDKIYPQENARLYTQIAKTGAVISEHPPHSRTYASDFVRRNRIIAGISHGVFVCQAPKRSGSLTTAKIALEEGRDLFCVAANAEQINEGSNTLLKEGAAKLILSAKDILEEYEHYSDRFDKDRLPKADTEPVEELPVKKKGRKFKGLSELSEKIVDFLEGRSAIADEICEGLDLSFSEIASELTELEISDILNNDNGNYSIKY